MQKRWYIAPLFYLILKNNLITQLRLNLDDAKALVLKREKLVRKLEEESEVHTNAGVVCGRGGWPVIGRSHLLDRGLLSLLAQCQVLH